jgi:hypothetical protein
MDLYLRQIVGWAMRSSMTSDLAIQASWRLYGEESLARSSDSFRSGQPVHRRRLAVVLQGSWHGAKHEPMWELSRQSHCREILQPFEEETNQTKDLPKS